MNKTKNQSPCYYIEAISALSDNYIWVIGDKSHNQIAIIDPGCAQVCIDYIKQHQVELTDILITHRHYDHTDGVDELVNYAEQAGQKVNIYAPANDEIPIHSNFQPLTDLDQISLNFTKSPYEQPQIEVMALSGHTKGHIGYLVEDKLFCGDTLFSAGCGRLFDGTAEQLWRSLKKIAALPEKTLIYCTHEYTLANINFALSIEPTNDELIHYFNQVQARREKGQTTLPTSVLLEKKINPFLRCHLTEVKKSVDELSHNKAATELATFTQLRKLKDNA